MLFLDKKIVWEGKAEEEKGYDAKTEPYHKVDQRYFRPTEVETLLVILQKQKKRWLGTKNF